MSFKEISHVLGKYLFFFSFLLFVPLTVSLYYDFIADQNLYPQPHCSFEFFLTILICLGISFCFKFWGRKAKGNVHRRESIILVVVIWLISCLIGALPFYLTKTLESPLDAYFETMSGFTTTGSSVMCPKAYDKQGNEVPIYDTNIHVPYKTYKYWGTITPVRDVKTKKILYSGVEAVGKGILFWRSFIQWVGGMGIVVLFLAILPTLAIGGKFLYQMEVPGPIKDTLKPRIKETASLLWKLYLLLTVLQIYFLIWTNPDMPLFDAFCITFTTLSSGGFTVTNNSIASYHNIHTEWVIIAFMVIGSINFGYYFYIIRRKFYRIYQGDLLFYLIVVIAGSALVSGNLIGKRILFSDFPNTFYTAADSIREGSFQAISALTSTGYFSTNYDLWPFASQMFMLILMVIGGMPGSTAGGIKSSRFYMLYKVIIHKIEAIFRPERVRNLYMGDTVIDDKTTINLLTFIIIAIFFIVFGTVLMVLDGVDPETALGSIVCMLHNVGIAFRAAGPLYSFALLPAFSKVVSILWMLLGRIEYFALLLLLVPGFWKTK